MRYPVKVVQERPVWTKAPYSRRFWELRVMNRQLGVYEYYASVGTFEEAIELAQRVWARSNGVNRPRLQEVTC